MDSGEPRLGYFVVGSGACEKYLVLGHDVAIP